VVDKTLNLRITTDELSRLKEFCKDRGFKRTEFSRRVIRLLNLWIKKKEEHEGNSDLKMRNGDTTTCIATIIPFSPGIVLNERDIPMNKKVKDKRMVLRLESELLDNLRSNVEKLESECSEVVRILYILYIFCATKSGEGTKFFFGANEEETYFW
jgi:hypothetical protein